MAGFDRNQWLVCVGITGWNGSELAAALLRIPHYKLRARIERTIGKLKRFKRVAMRCEKTDTSYSAIISFACGLMLVKSVHTA